MSVELITRKQWGARPPLRSLTQVPWSRRVGVAVHYTFGDKTDSPLDLQRYAQDTLGYADGHYNLLVDWLGHAYEGRGWTVSAAHSEGENVEWIGICFIGKDADVTPAAEATVAALVADADVLAGRKLKLAGHQELPGASTSCPGSRLMALVNRLRTGTDDDMFEQPDRGALGALYNTAVALHDGNTDRQVKEYGGFGKEPAILTAVKGLAADVAELKARPPVEAAPVDPVALRAALTDPEVLAAIAKAVTDEIGS